jgi:anti-sigma regulatory factor (Ser/Thr protein kinase)
MTFMFKPHDTSTGAGYGVNALDSVWPISSSYELPESAASPRLARSLVRSALAGFPEDVVDTVLLLVSELVTNAVIHGGSASRLHLQVVEGHVRVAVDDHSGEALSFPEEGVDPRDGGRGLVLVDALSSSWGCIEIEGGKRAWFELLKG